MPTSGLQIAFGGSSLEDSDSFVSSAANDFLEPGFNQLFPAELSSIAGDTIYILIRKRTNTAETTFESLTASDFSAQVTDATTGEVLVSTLALNSGPEIFSGWTTGDYTPLVLSITPFSEDDDDRQVRSIDIQVTEGTTKEFISARLSVSSTSQPFAYLTIDNRKGHLRNSTASFGTKTVVGLKDFGSYVILSPLATFEETASALADFSYPPGQVFYKAESTFNREPLSFSIDGVSHAAIRDNIKLISVHNSPYVAVVMIDGHLPRELEGVEGTPYVDIKATGNISLQEDTFRIVLARSDSINVL